MKILKIFALVLVTAYSAIAQDAENIFRVRSGGITGSYHDVEILNQNIAYCTNGFGLVVLEISDPRNPFPIRIIPTTGITQGIVLKDSLLFLCDGYKGLKVFDIQNDPENPREIGNFEGPRNATNIDIEGNYAYLWQERDRPNYIIDVTDPTQPEVVSTFNGYASAVNCVIGDYIFVGPNNAPLELWDASDREHPQQLQSFDDMRGGESLRLFDSDSILMRGKLIYSIRELESPELLDSILERGFVPRARENDNVIGIASLEIERRVGPGLAIYDLSHFDSPIRLSRIFLGRRGAETILNGKDLDYLSGLCILTNEDAGLTMYDVSNFEDPVQIGYYDPRGQFAECVEANGYLYVLDWQTWDEPLLSQRLRVYSLEEPTEPRLINTLEFTDGIFHDRTINRLKVIGDRLYASVDAAVAFFSLEDPENPVPFFRHYFNDNAGNAEDYEIDGDIVYGVQGCIRVYSIADLNNPEIISIVRRRNPPYDDCAFGGIALDEHYLYVCDTYAGLRIYNRDDPANLELLSVLYYEDLGRNEVIVTGETAYIGVVGGSARPTIIIDISDRSNPRFIGELDRPYPMEAMQISEGFLYLSCGIHGVYATHWKIQHIRNLSDSTIHPEPQEA